MRKLFLLVLIGACCNITFAQRTQITGRIVDTLEHKNLTIAVVALIKKSDSALYRFVRSDRSGQFNFQNADTSKYILLITYPKFADFSDEYNIISKPVNDLGPISLTLKSKILDAVVVRSAGAIRIKGDTTEFVADSFKLKEGATVED